MSAPLPEPRTPEPPPAPIQLTALRETDDLLSAVARRVRGGGGDGGDPVAVALQALVVEVDRRVATLTAAAPRRWRRRRLVGVPLATAALVVATSGIAAAVGVELAPVAPLQRVLVPADPTPVALTLLTRAEELLAGPDPSSAAGEVERLLQQVAERIGDLPEGQQADAAARLARARGRLAAVTAAAATELPAPARAGAPAASPTLQPDRSAPATSPQPPTGRGAVAPSPTAAQTQPAAPRAQLAPDARQQPQRARYDDGLHESREPYDQRGADPYVERRPADRQRTAAVAPADGGPAGPAGVVEEAPAGVSLETSIEPPSELLPEPPAPVP